MNGVRPVLLISLFNIICRDGFAMQHNNFELGCYNSHIIDFWIILFTLFCLFWFFFFFVKASVKEPPGSEIVVNFTPRFFRSNEDSSTEFKVSLSISLIDDYDDGPNNVLVNFEYYPLKSVNTLEYEVLEFCKFHEIERSGCISILFTSMESVLDAGIITNDVITVTNKFFLLLLMLQLVRSLIIMSGCRC